MDISLNLIDLQYLTNPDQMSKLKQKKEFQQIPRNDLDFYKKRIFQLTKDMLRGEKINTKVNKAFVNYALFPYHTIQMQIHHLIYLKYILYQIVYTNE